MVSSCMRATLLGSLVSALGCGAAYEPPYSTPVAFCALTDAPFEDDQIRVEGVVVAHDHGAPREADIGWSEDLRLRCPPGPSITDDLTLRDDSGSQHRFLFATHELRPSLVADQRIVVTYLRRPYVEAGFLISDASGQLIAALEAGELLPETPITSYSPQLFIRYGKVLSTAEYDDMLYFAIKAGSGEETMTVPIGESRQVAVQGAHYQVHNHTCTKKDCVPLCRGKTETGYYGYSIVRAEPIQPGG